MKEYSPQTHASQPENRNITRKGAKHILSDVEGAALCHFDPFGQAQGKLREKSFFRSLAFTRDDGPCPVTWRSWRLGASNPRFLELWIDPAAAQLRVKFLR